MVCILFQHEQDSDSAPYSWDPLAQTNWYSDSPPETSLVLCSQSRLLAAKQEPFAPLISCNLWQHMGHVPGSCCTLQPLGGDPGVGSWMASCAASQGWPGSSSSQRLVSIPSHWGVWDSPSSFLIRSCSAEILSRTEQPWFLSQISPLRCHTKH